MDKKTLELSVEKINIVSFYLNVENLSEFSIKEKNNVQFEYKLQTHIEIINELFGVHFEVKLLFENEVISNLKTYCEFKVIGLNDIAKKENDQIAIPSKIAGTLIAAAISTTRGIFFEKTSATPLEGLYLPLANLDEIMGFKTESIYKKNEEYNDSDLKDE
jgi:hypothetical protein